MYSNYKYNNGEIRIFIFIGIILGIIFYICTISKYFIEINVKILSILIDIFNSYIYIPIKRILKVIILPFLLLIDKIKQNKLIKKGIFNKKFIKKVAIKKEFKL